MKDSRAAYRNAISTFVGCDDLVGPISPTRGRIAYTFDFRCLDCGRFFKVFSAQDLSEYEKHLAYPGKATALVNVSDCYWDQSRLFNRKNPLLILPGENEQQIRAASTLLYSFSQIWEADHRDEDGMVLWRPLPPRASETAQDLPLGS